MNLRAGMQDATRTLFAWVLAVALLLPTIDICVCAADLNLADPVQIAAAPSHDSDESKGSLCRTCHCFHAVGLVRMERVAPAPSVANARLGSVPPDALHAAPAFMLLRPPRA